MSSWRIREIENKIRDLERDLENCTEKERYDLERQIAVLKSELKRLKRIEEEDEDDGSSALGMGKSLFGHGGFGGFGSSGHGFGGGGFGGGGSGGSW